jgi:branched-chain amino acid transport system substrate-binding protein
MTTRSPCTRTVVVAIAVLALLCAACSSGRSSGTPQSAASSALLGHVKEASGTPITVGYIDEGQSAGIDARPEVAAAGAAADYVNQYLGGVAGRPLKLMFCGTNGTSAGALNCANQMVAAKVPIVLASTPGEPGPELQTLSAAKIPFFTFAAADQSLLLSSDAYVLTNALGTLAVPIKEALDAGLKKVAMLLINLPAAVGPVESIAPTFFGNEGLTVKFAAIAPSTPDMTPQVQAAVSAGAQEFDVVGNQTFCTSALTALKTIDFKGPIVINSQCFSTQLAGSVPGGINGVKIGSAESIDPKDPQVALYLAVLAKYAPGTPPEANSDSDGFAVVLGFARAMTGFMGPVTPTLIQIRLASMAPQPMPLLSGETFQCNRTAVSLTPAACSKGAVIITLDASGKVKSTVAFNADPYIKVSI